MHLLLFASAEPWSCRWQIGDAPRQLASLRARVRLEPCNPFRRDRESNHADQGALYLWDMDQWQFFVQTRLQERYRLGMALTRLEAQSTMQGFQGMLKLGIGCTLHAV